MCDTIRLESAIREGSTFPWIANVAIFEPVKNYQRMSHSKRVSKVLHIALWVTQVVVAAGLIWGGMMKLSKPLAQLAAVWPWTAQVPVALLQLTGVLDLLGAAGLILPSLFRIQPKLTSIAAIGVIVLMICASVFHIVRGEASVIGVNIVFALMAAFIAWGRLRRASAMEV